MHTLKSKKTEFGFSLVEMLTAIILFLIVTTAIWGLLRVGNIDRNRTSRRSDALKNGRASLQLMGRDALNAGLFYDSLGGNGNDDFLSGALDFPVDPDNKHDPLPPVFAGNNVTTVLAVRPNTDMIAFAWGEEAFNGGVPIKITEADDTGAGVKLKTTFAEAARAETFDLYLITSGVTSINRTVALLTEIDGRFLKFETGDPLGINQVTSLLRPCSALPIPDQCTNYSASVTGALVQQISLITYKVKPDGTFVRTSYGNNAGGGAANQIQEQPIAYGVRDLQIRYVLNNGTTSDDPARNPADPAIFFPGNLSNVRQIIVNLTIENGIDENTQQPTTVNLSGSFGLRNIKYN